MVQNELNAPVAPAAPPKPADPPRQAHKPDSLELPDPVRRAPVEPPVDLVEKELKVSYERECAQGASDDVVQEFIAIDADRHRDPLNWWKENAHKFQRIAKVARVYLAMQATEAPAERVWNGVGDTLEPKRRSLNPLRVKELSFLRENYQLLKKLRLITS